MINYTHYFDISGLSVSKFIKLSIQEGQILFQEQEVAVLQYRKCTRNTKKI